MSPAAASNGHSYKHRTSEEINQLVRSGWMDGVPADEIAVALDVSLGFVGACVVEMGLPARDHTRRIIEGSTAEYGWGDKDEDKADA